MGEITNAQKTKLDGIGAGATVATVTSPTNSILLSGTPANPTVEQNFGITGNLGAVSVGGAADEGTSDTSARIDHVHPAPGVATPGVSGFISGANQTRLDSMYSQILFSGKHTGGAGAATSYIFNVGVNSGATNQTVAGQTPISAGTFLFLRVKCTTNALAAAMVVTVFKNGVATALTLTVTTGSTAVFFNDSDTVTFADNDQFDLVCQSTAAGVANALLSASLGFISP